MSHRVRYKGQRAIAINAPPLVERAFSDWPTGGDWKTVAKPLDLRKDLAPGLPLAFDWGRLGSRARCERLAVAILADTLAERVDGDELALRFFREFAREHVERFDDALFDFAASDAYRWLSIHERGQDVLTITRIRQQPRRA